MRHLIIGASAAGITAAKTIRQWEPDDEITVVSADTQVHSRCMLHHFLSGHRTAEGINFVAEDFFEKNRIRWLKGERVDRVDTAANLVHLDCGAEVPYDRLLIASGANFFIPPLPNFREAKNVYGLRDLSDAQKISKAAEGSKRCVIVGSGLVGLDAANALCARGISCAIVEMADRICPLQLDAVAAKPYQELFSKAGCTFYLAEKAAGSEIDAQGNIVSISLESGTVLPCDFVVVAAGVRPAIGFLEGSGLKTGRAVEVDRYLRTNIENVWAAGDVAGITGIWPNAMEQGETAAKNMCGTEVPYENTYGMKNTMNFYGLTTLSLGINTPQEGDEVVVRESRDSYKRAILRNGVVTHVILQGDISNAGFWQELVKHQIPVGHLKKSVFDLSYADFYQYDPKHGLFEWNLPQE